MTIKHTNFLKNFGKSFVNLVYPPHCMHCRQYLVNDAYPLCSTCLEMMQLIDPQERCPHCFSADYCLENKLCPHCLRKGPVLHGIAAAFDYVGPAASLIRKLKYSNQTHLADVCAAYLAAQFLKLEWPMPDLIVPIPIAFTHLLERGYNQSLLLAESLSKILNRPTQEILKRKSGDFSQAGLGKHQRVKLDGKTITLNDKCNVHDKVILLVDDVMTTGSTMKKSAEALLEQCPSSLYGLAVCRAI